MGRIKITAGAIGIATFACLVLAAAASAAPRPSDEPLRPALSLVADKPEMRSFQPYSGLQYGFRPRPPAKYGVRTSRPKVIMPKRVAPMIGYGDRGLSLGYAYCAESPGHIEPRTQAYGPRPAESDQCP